MKRTDHLSSLVKNFFWLLFFLGLYFLMQTFANQGYSIFNQDEFERRSLDLTDGEMDGFIVENGSLIAVTENPSLTFEDLELRVNSILINCSNRFLNSTGRIYYRQEEDPFEERYSLQYSNRLQVQLVKIPETPRLYSLKLALTDTREDVLSCRQIVLNPIAGRQVLFGWASVTLVYLGAAWLIGRWLKISISRDLFGKIYSGLRYLLLKETIFILLGTLMVLLPASPINSPYTSRDPGVFLYTGWRILNGELPYAHVWDHKPPVIFYLNALGLSITNGSVWGVWIIEFISLYLTAYLAFKLLSGLFGRYSAMFSTYLWMMSLVFMLTNGNYTEEYALLFQFGALLLFYQAQHKKQAARHYLGIGILGGLAFFTKQTTIGIWLAMAAYLCFSGLREKQIKICLKQTALILAGSLSVAVLVSGYFLINGAFQPFWDNAFLYNFYYTSGEALVLQDRLWNLIDTRYLVRTGLFQFAVAGVLAFIAISKTGRLEKPAVKVLAVALAALPLEILFINLPAIPYEHYFMTILPVLAIFSGLTFYILLDWLSRQPSINMSKFTFTLLVIFFLTLGSLRDYLNNLTGLQIRQNEPAIQYILSNTTPEDPILVWGAESMVNFFTRRPSPTKYVYQYPLYKRGYTSEDKIIEFLDDILENEPKYILDSMRPEYPIFTFPVQSVEIDGRLDEIKSNYRRLGVVRNWQVYEILSDSD